MVTVAEYWENRLAANKGITGVGYLALGEKYNSWLYRIRKKIFLSNIKKLFNDWNIDVLDVGAGTGFYIDLWSRLGVKNITGIDITNTAIQFLRRNYPYTFLKLDIGDDLVSLPANKFDAITAFDVLFHVVDDKRYENAIKNIFSLLKPGGIFIFSDNFLHGTPQLSDYQVSRNIGDIENILATTGFEIVKRVPMAVLMNYPIDSSSRVYKKAWNLMRKIISINNTIGFAIGAMLYPIELICVSGMKESPTTEMMICKKAQ